MPESGVPQVRESSRGCLLHADRSLSRDGRHSVALPHRSHGGRGPHPERLAAAYFADEALLAEAELSGHPGDGLRALIDQNDNYVLRDAILDHVPAERIYVRCFYFALATMSSGCLW